MNEQDIASMIESGIEGCEARVGGDGTHFDAIVISDAFAGKNMLQQHRMVYQALGDSMQTAIHALSIKTYTREEWARVRQQSAS